MQGLQGVDNVGQNLDYGAHAASSPCWNMQRAASGGTSMQRSAAGLIKSSDVHGC